MRINIIVIVIVGTLSGTTCDAQTFNEWFRQGKTQRRYLRKQIALLKVYLTYLQEGYDIAQDGLALVSDIKDGEFSLHRDYFTSLKNVNPHLPGAPQVANVFELQVLAVRVMQDANSFCRGCEYFTEEELHYVSRVHANLLESINRSLSELRSLLHSGAGQMTDYERLKRIDELYIDMQDKYSFARSFAAQLRMLAAERERERNAIEGISKQHDVI